MVERERPLECRPGVGWRVPGEKCQVALRLAEHEPRFDSVRVRAREVRKNFDRRRTVAVVVRVVPLQQLAGEWREATAVKAGRGQQLQRIDATRRRPALCGRQSNVGQRERAVVANRRAKCIARRLRVTHSEITFPLEKGRQGGKRMRRQRSELSDCRISGPRSRCQQLTGELIDELRQICDITLDTDLGDWPRGAVNVVENATDVDASGQLHHIADDERSGTEPAGNIGDHRWLCAQRRVARVRR